MKRMPRIGEWVRLIDGRKNDIAQVTQHLADVDGGVRLDRRLEGFQFWNKEDLEPADPAPDPIH